MNELHFTHEDEHRMLVLQKRQENDGDLTSNEFTELASLEYNYQLFLDKGDSHRSRGELLSSTYTSPARTANGGTSSAPFMDTPFAGVSESLNKAGKAAYFWGSLVATAVPGYLGKKAGLTSDFLHWNFIVDKLILGALPVLTQVGSSGHHLWQLQDQLRQRDEKLGMVVACLEDIEMDGFGLSILQFAKEEDWRACVNPSIEYVRVPMQDTTASVPFDLVANAVDRMRICIRERGETVYVHCKAGKGRSWMLVMAYLMVHDDMTFEEAAALVRDKRGQISPSVSQQCFAREFPYRYAQRSGDKVNTALPSVPLVVP